MPEHITELLADRDLETLADLLADNPDVFAKLADAVTEKVGEKIYDQGWNTDGIEKRLDKIEAKLTDHERRFDVLARNFQTLGEKLDGIERRTSQRLDRIDDHLSINTRRAS